ncbi:MAG TPA: thiamine-phosphate kinase [Candidatus Acidoferrales bacterium]|nr:thiamine-phosphate kinase [Candidatus Acidoferrales bacterium]
MREDDVVAAIRAIVEPGGATSVLLGIGDDAAIWQPSRSNRSAITTDALVEGVHFSRDLMTLYDAGWRAIVANASDLAAMGARPVLATVALGVPADTGEASIVELYRGIAAAASATGLTIAGGDLTRAPVLTISVAAVGEVRPSNVKTRSGGRPGGVLAVTGPLGAARAGLALARAGSKAGPEASAALDAFRRPQARCAEGRFLAASRNVEAMMDLSDGLSTDLLRLCAASGCGALLSAVPAAQSARAVAAERGEDPERFALAGGEDFELLVAVRPRAFDYLAKRFERRFGRPLHRIGTLRAGSGIALARDGGEEAVGATGWDHFTPAEVLA